MQQVPEPTPIAELARVDAIEEIVARDDGALIATSQGSGSQVSGASAIIDQPIAQITWSGVR